MSEPKLADYNNPVFDGPHRVEELEARRKPKYEVQIFKLWSIEGRYYWRAVLVCNCGDKPEHMAIQEIDFGGLMTRLKFALNEHEESTGHE